MKRRLAGFPAKVLQHLGLLIAFVLLVAANEFASANPALTSILVFVFSLPYLLASVVTRRADFLYATMLLGAVSYFLACHALGAPGSAFPLLSVPLVAALWLVGQYLRRRVPAELAAYPQTVFNAMNITVAVFTVWAIVQVFGLLREDDWLRYVAGLAFLGYAVLYLAHSISRAHFMYTYVFAGYLVLGGSLLVGAVESVDYCWIPVIASAATILLVGFTLHPTRGYGWSRHFYFSAAGAIAVSLVLSMFRWQFFLVDLAAASLLLWAAYGWLGGAVKDVRHAMLAERVIAKGFFMSSLALSAPIAPILLLFPTDVYVACAALVSALTFAWIGWQRRSQSSVERNGYLLGAALFASAGLMGLGRQLPGLAAPVWSPAGAILLLAALAAARRLFDRAKDQVSLRSLAEAAIFPTFFAWYVPLLQGEMEFALAGAGAALAVAVILGVVLKERYFAAAAGPAIAGAVAGGALLAAGQSMAGWVVCAAGAAVAGLCFVVAEAREKHVPREAAYFAWAILTVASVTIAAYVSMTDALYSVTVVGAVAILIAGRPRRREAKDPLDLGANVLAVLATGAAVVLGPISGIGLVGAGVIALALALAHWVAWGMSRGTATAYAANGLMALGLVLVIFGVLPAADARLGAGAGVVLLLFTLGAVMRGRFPSASSSAVITGHLTSLAMAVAALNLAWPETMPLLPAAAAPYVLIYALMPALRKNLGFRIGAPLWLSLAALFSLSVATGTPYQDHALPVAILSLVWLAVGYVLGRHKAGDWPVPLYVSAGVLSAFCGAISLMTPEADGFWRVFLVNGIVFACLFLILRQDVFAYLVTLSLSLMAYDWVKASTTPFTQDVLFYLVIGAGVLTLFFAMIPLKRLITRMGSVPMISIFTWRGAALLSIPIAGVAFVVLSAYSLEITGHPKFCTSCHYMGNYYESWQHSSHAGVACIKCHYEPGVTAEVQGKVAGLVQVVKYVSHSYTSKPHAMISNESCMREGCHAGMDRSRETLLFGRQIRFRHDRHLSGLPRGKQLNCVSCHGQTVEGKHISVAETACLTCHFHGRSDGQAVAVGQCQTCHVVPERTVTFMGQAFNHREFLKAPKAVQCTHCHSQVTQGDGATSTTRCRSCHLRVNEKIEDQAQFHLVHVSRGHFDCLQCHDEIQHGVQPMNQQLLASGNCKTCHGGERHSLQEKIYAGTAVPQLKAVADPMYKAGVACSGCHTDVQTTGLGETPFTKKLSGTKQCTDCHGSQVYGRMLVAWQEETKDRVAKLQPQLDQLEKACQTSQAPEAQVAKVRRAVAAAKTNLSYVLKDGSFGAHNIAYVTAILDSVEADIKTCRPQVAELGQPAQKQAAAGRQESAQ